MTHVAPSPGDPARLAVVPRPAPITTIDRTLRSVHQPHSGFIEVSDPPTLRGGQLGGGGGGGGWGGQWT